MRQGLIPFSYHIVNSGSIRTKKYSLSLKLNEYTDTFTTPYIFTSMVGKILETL
jgi:hypothetical protein